MTAAGQLGAGRGAARRRGLTCTTSAMSCSTAPIASPRSTAPPPVHRGVGIAEALKKKALGVQDRWDHKGVGVTPRPAGRPEQSRARTSVAGAAAAGVGRHQQPQREEAALPLASHLRVTGGAGVGEQIHATMAQTRAAGARARGRGRGRRRGPLVSVCASRKTRKRRNQGRGTCAISAACSARAASCTQHIMPHQPKMMGPCRIEWRWVPKPPAFAGTPRPRRLNPTAQSAAPSIAHQLVQGLGVGDMGLLGAEQLPVPARPGFGGRRGIFPEMPFHVGVCVCVCVGGSAAPQQAFELAVGL
jgi:hypothetical protein